MRTVDRLWVLGPFLLIAACVDPPASVTTTPVRGAPGSSCVADTDCETAPGAGDGFCYIGDMGPLEFPELGSCTVDDGSGAVCDVDADCPTGSLCIDADGYKLCLPACGENGACPADQACLSSFSGVPLDRPACVPGNAGAVDGDACTGAYQCNADSLCWNDLEHPGGSCATYGCTLGDDSTCNGGTCVEFRDGLSTGTICAAACTVDSDCRDEVGYRCVHPGGDGTPGYCRHPHVGDPCSSYADCGGDGWTCRTDTGFTDGYCTLEGCPTAGTTEGCSSGAICAAVGQVNTCLDRCATVGTTSTCRTGYTCTSVGDVNGGACLPTTP